MSNARFYNMPYEPFLEQSNQMKVLDERAIRRRRLLSFSNNTRRNLPVFRARKRNRFVGGLSAITFLLYKFTPLFVRILVD